MISPDRFFVPFCLKNILGKKMVNAKKILKTFTPLICSKQVSNFVPFETSLSGSSKLIAFVFVQIFCIST